MSESLTNLELYTVNFGAELAGIYVALRREVEAEAIEMDSNKEDDNVFASLQTVLSLWWNDDLKEFREIWWWVFLWALFSSIFVHSFAFLISLCSLHKHKQGRWYCLSIAVMGILTPITEGVISSAIIAGVYVSLGWAMVPKFALVWGAGQTFLVVVLSWSRLLPTL